MKHNQVQFHKISEETEGQRIDNYLISHLKGVPKTHIYRIIRKGEVRVNKKRIKPSYKLLEGDEVRIPPIITKTPKVSGELPEAVQHKFESHILYEDEVLLVINKPPGLPVHGGTGESFGVIDILRQLRPAMKTLELVHRLDKFTSGCLVLAKGRAALKTLQASMREKPWSKRYWALVHGTWPKDLIQVDKPLKKNHLSSGARQVVVSKEGKAALTLVKIEKVFPQYTLLELSLVTGRTHQIRVHTSSSGHPIVNDPKYGDRELDKESRGHIPTCMYLHAHALSFPHPVSGEILAFEAPLFKEFKEGLERLG